MRIAELERRVPEMHFSFLSGKQVEMEEKVLELQKPLEEDTEKNQECKEKKETSKIFRFAWLLFNVIFFFLLKYSR